MEREKRKYLRFECLIPVDLLEVEEPGGDAQGAKIENISREGLRVVVDIDRVFQPGDDVNFQIQNTAETRTGRVEGEVIWSRSVGDEIEIGLKIKKIENRTKADLLEMGYGIWRKRKEENPPESKKKK